MKIFGKVEPPDASVTIISVDGNHTNTKAIDGKWESEVLEGVYRFTFFHDEYHSETIHGRVNKLHSENEFPDVKLRSKDDTKEKYSVVIKNGSDEPVIDAQVQVFPKGSADVFANGRTDERGYFETFLDPKQEWDIYVFKSGFNNEQPKVLKFGAGTP